MAESLTPEAETAVNAALAAHNNVRHYVLDDDAHAVIMFLADLIDYADACTPRLDLDAMLSQAREIAAECKT